MEYALRELRRRKARTFVNITGHIMAVGLMFVLMTWLQYSRKSSEAILGKVGTHFIVFAPSEHCCPGITLPDSTEGFVAMGVTTKLFPANYVDKVKSLSTIKDASPYLSFRFRDPKDHHLFTVGGFDPAKPVSVGSTTCAPTDLVSGRFIKPEDKQVAMLEMAYAQAQSLKTGGKIKIAGEDFTIISIVAPATRPAKADVYMHIRDAERIITKRGVPVFKYTDKVNVVLVEVKNSKVQAQAVLSVKAIDPELMVSGFACYAPAAKVMGMNEKAVWLLTLIIGLGVLVFSLKSQLSSVIERQHDIGILKAIGWSNRNVVSQIIWESVIQSVIGGIIGIMLAVLLVLFVPTGTITGVQENIKMPVAPLLIIIFLALSVIGGIIAGFFPALRASRKRPADALRNL